MYEVFIQNHRLRLSPDEAELKDPERIESELDRNYLAQRILDDFTLGRVSERDVQDEPESFLRALWSKFEHIEAAGGRIRNEGSDILMIYRLGHWDLPKGKIEPGEHPEEAARREIEEECGLIDLELVQELPASYHIYEQRGRRFLKKTHWFEYRITRDQTLVPQREEGIEMIEWLNEDQIRSRKNFIYPSLYPLLPV